MSTYPRVLCGRRVKEKEMSARVLSVTGGLYTGAKGRLALFNLPGLSATGSSQLPAKSR